MLLFRSMAVGCEMNRLRTNAIGSTNTLPQQQQQQALPTTCRRLVAKRTAKSFREAAEVEEVDLPQPGANEVGCS